MLWSFGQVRVTKLYPGMRTSSIFNTQHVAAGWPNVRSMLRPTMLRYVALKCCDRLAGACKCCETILVKITDEWLEAMDKGHFTGVVMIDLRKAFDVVDHKETADLWLEQQLPQMVRKLPQREVSEGMY